MEQEAILASQAWVNAGGMILILLGFSFVLVEFFLPSFGLFGFSGACAFLVGIIQLHQTGYIEHLPISVNALVIMALIVFALAAVGGYFTFKLYQKRNTTGVEAMLGEAATIISWSGKKGRVSIDGEQWQAYADDAYDLRSGDKVLVSKIDGLKIKIAYTNSQH